MRDSRIGRRLGTLGVVFVLFGKNVTAEEAAADNASAEFFKTKVRPILVENCVRCHGERKHKAELRFDTAEGFAKGSESGPVVVPKDLEKSLLIQAVRRVGDLKMPPSDALDPEAVAVLEQWVKDGAFYPAEGLSELEEKAEVVETEKGDDPLKVDGHKEWVTSLDFSPDGSTLMTGGGEPLIIRAGMLRLFDPATGAEIDAAEGHSGPVWSVRFSPDGRTVATAGYDKLVKLWEIVPPAGDGGTIELKERAALEGHKNWVTCVAFSPDGSLLASGSEDATIRLWNPAEGKEIAALEGHGATVRAVAFSPDGKLLASASFDKTVKLWDIEKRSDVASADAHEDAVWCVSFSPDGKLLASGGADNLIKVWNIGTGAADGGPQLELRATLAGHANWVTSLAFAPDGIHLASGSYDRTAKLWDTLSQKESGTLKPQESAVWCVRFSPDGKKLYLGTGSKTGEEETLLCWPFELPAVEPRAF